MIINIKQIRPYRAAQAELVPLHVFNKRIGGLERGKTPIHNNWRELVYTTETLDKLAKAGHNLGYRIPERIVIVDLDPRNYVADIDTESLIVDLFECLDFDDIRELYPVVKTGGGGYHIYCKIPKGIEHNELQEITKELPGVEFKKFGRQVVCAGSKHPNGNFYKWDCNRETVKQFAKNKIPLLPEKIIELIKRNAVKRDYESGFGSVTGLQLKELFLDKLNVDEFDSNDSWFPILCASHHVSGGEGVDEFVQWSLQDLNYEADENSIRNRWESLNDKKESLYTVGTLIHELEKRGEETSNAKAILDFSKAGSDEFMDEDHTDDEEKDLMSSVNDSEYDIDLEDLYKVDKDDCAGEEGAAIKFAHTLGPSSNDEEIEKALRLCKVANKIESARSFNLISQKTGIAKPVLNKIIKDSQEQLKDDLSRLLAEATLKNVFENGKHLMTLPSGLIYYYAKNHWKELNSIYLEKIIMINLDKVRKKLKIDVDQDALIKKCLAFIKRYTAHNTDKLHSTGTPKAIVNCKNGEIWIKDDGTHILKPHNYKSHQLQVLDTEYDPSAECPLFIQTIKEIFELYDDRDEIVDYLAEVFGYIIQPNKNLANWWLFKGPGGDGKSTLLRILGGILGESQLKTSTRLLSSLTDDSGNKHATISLIGKLNLVIEELPAKYLLKDSALKMLSESTKMEADPKHGKVFNFTYSGALVMCSNRYPSTSDISYGMQRRANVIAFNRQFTVNGQEDIGRVEKIFADKKEVAGILNWMLQGLYRLRSRGHFEKPKSVKKETENWLGVANPVVRFVADKVKRVKMSRGCSLSDIRAAYHSFCHENDLKPKAKMTLVQDLEDLGFVYGTGGGNKRVIYGAHVEIDDFDDIDEELENL